MHEGCEVVAIIRFTIPQVSFSFGDYPVCSEGLFDEKFKGWGLLICGSLPSIWYAKDVGWVPHILSDPIGNDYRFIFLWLVGLASLPLSS